MVIALKMILMIAKDTPIAATPGCYIIFPLEETTNPKTKMFNNHSTKLKYQKYCIKIGAPGTEFLEPQGLGFQVPRAWIPVA